MFSGTKEIFFNIIITYKSIFLDDKIITIYWWIDYGLSVFATESFFKAKIKYDPLLKQCFYYHFPCCISLLNIILLNRNVLLTCKPMIWVTILWSYRILRSSNFESFGMNEFAEDKYFYYADRTWQTTVVHLTFTHCLHILCISVILYFYSDFKDL